MAIQAFAVYFADDKSLNFYKRDVVPSAGEQFEGKTATYVWTGIEDENITMYAPDTSSSPFSDAATTCEQVAVVDDGIAPKSTAYWFDNFYCLINVDVAKLDMSRNTDTSHMFFHCSYIKSLDLSSWDTSAVKNAMIMFYHCVNLEKVAVGDKFTLARELPATDSYYIPGADGNWYNSRGHAFAPSEIPGNIADTYYASKNLLPKATAYIGAPGKTQITESNISSFFEVSPQNCLRGSSITIGYENDIFNKGPVVLTAKQDTDISFDFSFYRLNMSGTFEFYINSKLVDSLPNDEKSGGGKWSGKISKGEALRIQVEINNNITREKSLRVIMELTATLSNIQVSTKTGKTTARKIANCYVGVPTQVPIYEEQTVTKDVETLITPANISKFFTVTKPSSYYFTGDASGKYTSNNKNINNSTAQSNWTAKKQIKKLTFSYKVSSESSYDKYTIIVDGNTIANNISGSGSVKSYSGSLASGKAITLKYTKDGSNSNNDDCGSIWDIKVTTSETITENVEVGKETKEVARKVKKAYVGVLTDIPIYEQQQVTKDVETKVTPSNISKFFDISNSGYYFTGDANGLYKSNNKGRNSTTAQSTWKAKKRIKGLSFSYKVSSESNYDKYTVTVGGTTVANNISGNGTTKIYTGSLSSGASIVLKYVKDSSNGSYDDCGSIWDIDVTTTETVTENVFVGSERKNVARLCYTGVQPLPPIPAALEECSWSDLHRIANGYAHDEIKHLIGMTKNVAVNGVATPFQLIGIGQDEAVYGTDVLMTFQCKDCLPSDYYMNSSGSTTGGWASSQMRTYLQSTILNQFDADTNAAIVPVKKKYTTTRNGSMNISNDTLWLASEWELLGSNTYGTSNEGNFYEYWSKNNNGTARIKKLNGNNHYWWARSVYSSYYFCFINGKGETYYNNANTKLGVVPCFCI